MKKTGAVLSFVLAFGLGASLLFAQGQSQAHRRIVVPDSSVEHPGDRGKKAHTNHLILVSPDTLGRANAQPLGETPSSLACVYNLVRKLAPGCPVATSKDIPSGGNGTIAIVGAYDYPTAYDDLSTFSKQFGEAWWCYRSAGDPLPSSRNTMACACAVWPSWPVSSTCCACTTCHCR